MQKHRVILIVVSLIFIIVLYFLPRFVVNNEEDQNLGTATDAEVTSADNGGNDDIIFVSSETLCWGCPKCYRLVGFIEVQGSIDHVESQLRGGAIEIPKKDESENHVSPITFRVVRNRRRTQSIR